MPHTHHHQLNVHFLPKSIKGMYGCFPTALGRQSTFSNFWDLLFSHSDASISRKSRLVTILKAAVYPWECWSEFLVAGCSSATNQLGLGKRSWNREDLFSGSWISASTPTEYMPHLELVHIRVVYLQLVNGYWFDKLSSCGFGPPLCGVRVEILLLNLDGLWAS